MGLVCAVQRNNRYLDSPAKNMVKGLNAGGEPYVFGAVGTIAQRIVLYITPVGFRRVVPEAAQGGGGAEILGAFRGRRYGGAQYPH